MRASPVAGCTISRYIGEPLEQATLALVDNLVLIRLELDEFCSSYSRRRPRPRWSFGGIAFPGSAPYAGMVPAGSRGWLGERPAPPHCLHDRGYCPRR